MRKRVTAAEIRAEIQKGLNEAGLSDCEAPLPQLSIHAGTFSNWTIDVPQYSDEQLEALIIVVMNTMEKFDLAETKGGSPEAGRRTLTRELI